MSQEFVLAAHWSTLNVCDSCRKAVGQASRERPAALCEKCTPLFRERLLAEKPK